MSELSLQTIANSGTYNESNECWDYGSFKEITEEQRETLSALAKFCPNYMFGFDDYIIYDLDACVESDGTISVSKIVTDYYTLDDFIKEKIF